MLSSNRPAGPAKLLAAWSSSSPGASPTIIQSAEAKPSPKIACWRDWHKPQPVQAITADCSCAQSMLAMPSGKFEISTMGTDTICSALETGWTEVEAAPCWDVGGAAVCAATEASAGAARSACGIQTRTPISANMARWRSSSSKRVAFSATETVVSSVIA